MLACCFDIWSNRGPVTENIKKGVGDCNNITELQNSPCIRRTVAGSCLRTAVIAVRPPFFQHFVRNVASDFGCFGVCWDDLENVKYKF